MIQHYDLVVIGSGPGGQKAAIQAAKLGKSVALIERQQVVGGVCINTGTIPSKSLREAVIYLAGLRERSFYDPSLILKRRIAMTDLLTRCEQVIRNEIAVVRSQLTRNNVEVVYGTATLIDAHTLFIESVEGDRRCSTDFIVLATGSSPTRPSHIPFDDEIIVDSKGILHLAEIPPTLLVIGGGIVGAEYASVFAALGVKVTLVERSMRLLGFLDPEISEALSYHMRQKGVTLLLGEEVASLAKSADRRVVAELLSGKRITAHTALYAVGRNGAIDGLGLEKVGIEVDKRGRIKVNECYQTSVPTIYAAGDVIGFPSLAATAMEQGRLASCHAFGEQCVSMPELLPFGIYTIPEISMIGPTEEQLTKERVPYEQGRARYREIARGQLLGEDVGMLKVLVHQDSRRLLAVHGIGTGTTEIIHIGQAVMYFQGTIDYFLTMVFNYPTLAECYKVAALDCVNRLREAASTSASMSA